MCGCVYTIKYSHLRTEEIPKQRTEDAASERKWDTSFTRVTLEGEEEEGRERKNAGMIKKGGRK